MKLFKITCAVILSVSILGCGHDEVTLQGLNGAPGADGSNGVDGKNGHSLVSQYLSASDLECETSGSRLDIYLDMDDSLSVSDVDIYQNSLITCNGANGLNGEDGIDGAQGPQGIPGQQGPRGARGKVGPKGDTGPQGEQGEPGPQGLPGEPGAPGADGQDGQDGEDGQDGQDGEDGTSASIVSYTSSSCAAIVGTSYYTKANGSNNGIYTASNCHSSSKVFELGEGDSVWLSSNSLAVKLLSTGIRVISFN